jgi:hypothetical protein
MRDMKVNLIPFVSGLACFSVVYGLMAGKVQEFIYFADPLNEMAMAFLLSMIGGVSFLAAFEKKNVNNFSK